MSGSLEAIWIKRVRRGPMDSVPAVGALAGQGLVGNANQRGCRQVTVVDADVLDRVARELPDFDPAMRRANLMVRGVDLNEARGRVLTVGGVRVRIEGRTAPCNLMEEQCPGLRAALDEGWAGGAYGVVLDDGEVGVGDPVSLREATDDELALPHTRPASATAEA